MTKLIKEYLIQATGLGDTVKVDKAFVAKINKMVTGFTSKNDDHMEFFGNGLTGYKRVIFSISDRDKIFEILGIEEVNIKEGLYDLHTIGNDKRKAYTINNTWKVAGDIFNITCTFVMGMIERSNHLTDKEKQDALITMCNYMLFRFLTSLIYAYFKYTCSKEVAMATYNNLSNKFVLRREGNWLATLTHLSTRATKKDNNKTNKIYYIDDDETMLANIANLQGYVRSMLKNVYEVFVNTKRDEDRHISSNSLGELDGEVILKDNDKSLSNYTRYIKTIVKDRNSFMKDELIDIIIELNTNVNHKPFKKLLEYCSNNYNYDNDKISKSLELIMINSFSYLSSNYQLLRQTNFNVSDMLIKLKGTIMSSKSNTDVMVNTRNICMEVVMDSKTTKNEAQASSLRCALMLYVFLRAISINRYS